MRLAEPWWLLLLGLIPLYWLGLARRGRLLWPTLAGFKGAPRAAAGVWRFLPGLLMGLGMACAIVGLARPRTVAGRERIAAKGVAIIVALDRSSSMDAVDFPLADGGKVSRLEAARETVARFVAGRPDDLIGLVAFANYPDLACPPTLDHGFVIEMTRGLLSASDPGEDGTNIGDAVVWALGALEPTAPTRKVMVLLTDGENRPQGIEPAPMDPLSAADLARGLGMTLHTIAIGRGGLLRVTEPTTGLARPAGEVDGPNLRLLEMMADRGGGKAFTATDAGGLEEVFATIDALERSPIEGEIRTRYREHYPVWLAGALGLIGLKLLLGGGRLRQVP